MPHPFSLRIAHLGMPCSTDNVRRMVVQVPWDDANLDRLLALGFNAIQLNVAWGSRPDDEILNLEDIVALTPEEDAAMPQTVPLRGNPGPEAYQRRRRILAERLALCRRKGIRTIFHCGIPYNAHARYGDAPPNCISDPVVGRRYAALIAAFHRDFPGVDDLWLYTYDQDAWLCDEFGPCPRCRGIPLHERLAPFIAGIAAAWRTGSPQGRTWWEPWELSSGQVLECVRLLPVAGMGLALHSNVAEVMSTRPVDRWLVNTAAEAAARGLPVVVEHFLGGACEEMEPYTRLAHPLVTWRALRAIAAVPGVTGIKEYFGLDPSREDPNLRATGRFLAGEELSEDALLERLSEPYGPAAAAMRRAWRLAGSGQELFPWECSWFVRQVGTSRTDFALSAAMIRGQQAHTPSWESTRRSIFMKTDNGPCDPWLLEDLELRFRQAAGRWSEALAALAEAVRLAPADLVPIVTGFSRDLASLRRRAVAYACHLRATNLATMLRRCQQRHEALPSRMLAELAAVLAEARDNHATEGDRPWPEISAALADLAADPAAFLGRWLQDAPDATSRGPFSITSR